MWVLHFLVLFMNGPYNSVGNSEDFHHLCLLFLSKIGPCIEKDVLSIVEIGSLVQSILMNFHFATVSVPCLPAQNLEDRHCEGLTAEDFPRTTRQRSLNSVHWFKFIEESPSFMIQNLQFTRVT
jgi:hypothetical protein